MDSKPQIIMPTSFSDILTKYRTQSYSQKDKGERFERLMQAYLLTDPIYANKFKKVWLWNEFHGREDLGTFDTGIDLVAQTNEGEYWAIQCKCYQESTTIDKPAVDSFLSTSSRKFTGEDNKKVGFAHRLWISTSNRWGVNAEEAFKNQDIDVSRINLNDLQEAPVRWDKLEKGVHGDESRVAKKKLRAHQTEALGNTHSHFKTADRGQLIMACGTGKTFTSLKIAENETKGKGLVLFLVPSIALLGQTLREWSAEADEPINAVCICSDPEISRKKTKNDDNEFFSTVDLALPASTNPKEILNQFNAIKARKIKGMTVVFSTYQSIEVIAKAQKELMKNGFGEFDLIICDEAHRTTGVTIAGEDESAFVKVHDNDFIKGKKRIYMTATPRLYDDNSKSQAAKEGAPICSMDDEKLYGKEIYRIGFGEAVDKGLLTDYKVLILTLNENDIPPAVQKMIADKDSSINSNDAAKFIGSINALSKQILGDEGIIKDTDPEPMRRAVAFCSSIKESNKITDTYNTATEAYINALPKGQADNMVSVASRHIDGTMQAPQRDELLGWLKGEPAENECRILTNVRCLSEGVDVPSLDAVLFLSARNSQVDVVQSVGRVMRRSEGKRYGYIIIPVVVPINVDADKAMDDNETYKVVWTVLNALRAHDDRFNAIVNKINLNKNRPEQILVGRTPTSFDDAGNPVYENSNKNKARNQEVVRQMSLEFEQLQHVVFARMVKKVGDKRYWEQWAKNVGEIAERQGHRIAKLVKEDTKHRKEFANFLAGLQKNINPSITEQEAVEMLSQHIITKPVFEALFEGYSFVKNNPISVSMQKMLDMLEDQSFEKDAETLLKFYDSVKMRISGIDNAEGKQKIIVELYDKFFKTAFPKMVERLGIVYTPVEVVDFIIHSVNDVLKKEFGRSISDENIHVLDPFTGTGTFMTRLLQSGLISKKDLLRKYQNELHANEIVLLAYYIAAVNIENAFHDISNQDEYVPFDGICLTDTFQLGETDEGEKLFSEMFPQNSARVAKQKKAPLRVIMGNPPYSIGQRSENDNARNQEYPKLNQKISDTYVRFSKAGLKNSMYDSYIKAFRWSSDRLDSTGGIICFVSNGAWIDGNASDGFRKSLEKEFSSIYVFNLRGNARTSGDLRQKEAGNVFGSGSRTPIAITLLVKNPKHKNEKATIQYHNIGDYLNRDEKLTIVKSFKSIINDNIGWKKLEPNDQGDWVNLRNEKFKSFISIGQKDKFGEKETYFTNQYSNGIKTQRDAWMYNSSIQNLENNMRKTISFYNQQMLDYSNFKNVNKLENLDGFISLDETKISWTVNLKRDLDNGKNHRFSDGHFRTTIYRPFFKQHLYFSKAFIERAGLNSLLFPNPDSVNLAICIPGAGDNKEFSTLMVNTFCDYGMLGGAQCLPLYLFDDDLNLQGELFESSRNKNFKVRDGLSNFIFRLGQKKYGNNVTYEDIFYYVYGFLHSPDYREIFANDLKKMLPRLPLVDDVKDFWAFSKAGRKLADLHINYESVPAYGKLTINTAGGVYNDLPPKDFIVEKMRFTKKDQKDTIIYNNKITISNIPAKAYEYVVNGKSAIEWIMERYQVTTHKESGITNDPNDWGKETGNPRYVFDLLLSVINVSLQTVDIVNGLPKIDFTNGQ